MRERGECREEGRPKLHYNFLEVGSSLILLITTTRNHNFFSTQGEHEWERRRDKEEMDILIAACVGLVWL